MSPRPRASATSSLPPSPALAACLAQLVERYDSVVVDLAGLRFADSRFVTTLHHAGMRHPAGTVRLRNPWPTFRRMSQIFGLGQDPT